MTPISLSTSPSFDEHATQFTKESAVPLESQLEIEPLNGTSKSSEKDSLESETIQKLIEEKEPLKEVPEFQNDAHEVEKPESPNQCSETPEMDMIIQTEEGPIPVCRDEVVSDKPEVTLTQDNDEPKVQKEVEVLLEAVDDRMKEDPLSSTTVPKEILAGGESAQVSTFECNRTEPNTSLSEPALTTRNESKNEDDIPPPLPESPAPVIQESAKILSFVNAEVPPTIVTPPELSEPINELISCPLPLNMREESIQEMIPEISADMENSKTELPEAPAACVHIDDPRSSEDVSDSLDDLPPVPLELSTCEENSSDYPLPPDNLSLQSLPAENQESRILTESFLTPPRSPSPASVSVTTTATTIEYSETQLCDGQSNCDFKMESVSQSLNSYNVSEPESKEILVASESLTCQLLNGHIASENHQVTKRATSWHECVSQIHWRCLNSSYFVVSFDRLCGIA